jgi:hypothetical protein
MLFGFGAEVVEDDARFDPGNAATGVNLKDLCHILRKVEDDGRVAALSCERGTGATGEQRSAILAAKGDGGKYILFIARDDDTDGNLAVVRTVGGVEGAAAGVEADFSAEMATEGGFERCGIKMRDARRG